LVEKGGARDKNRKGKKPLRSNREQEDNLSVGVFTDKELIQVRGKGKQKRYVCEKEKAVGNKKFSSS